ncbi:MAG: DUF6111 family protein [Halocynthiibacter sp.]
MGRVILFEFVIFLLPFLAYAAWAHIRRGERTEPLFNDAPVYWLSVTGLVGVLVGFLSFSSITRTGTDVVYEPARMVDGVIVPGRAVPRDQADGN